MTPEYTILSQGGESLDPRPSFSHYKYQLPLADLEARARQARSALGLDPGASINAFGHGSVYGAHHVPSNDIISIHLEGVSRSANGS